MKAFPASVIEHALRHSAERISKRAVLAWLKGVPTDERAKVRGQDTKAWLYAVLPTPLRAKLEAAAREQNFAGPEALLGSYVNAERQAPTPPAEKPQVEAACDLHAALQEALDAVADKGNPTVKEKELVWLAVCEHLNGLTLPNGGKVAFKRSLTRWLQSRLPALGASVRSIERNLLGFRQEGPGFLSDLRPQRSGYSRSILCDACWEKLWQLNLVLTRASHTWRELKSKGLLCAECADNHKFNIRTAKSRVPNSIRAALTPITEKALHFAKSDSAGRMAGPKINCTYGDDFAPGDWFVADDVSWNHEVYTHHADGTPYLCRPECLYMADERTSYPLHYVLIPGVKGQKASFNSYHVRLLMLETHDRIGLPNRGYPFENGPFNCRMVRGEAGENWMPWAETEMGFRSLQDHFVITHTRPRTPTGKPTIESDIGKLQQCMRTLPGFVGFNERAEKTDRMKRLEADFKRRVKEGKEHPGNEFHSLTQFAAEVGKVMEAYANEPQNGKRLPGVSPLEAWGTPTLRKLPDESRWILASHRELLKVTERGLTIRKHNYANEKLARYIGQRVWAFYNLEYPRLLTVCDQKRTDYFSVTELTAPARTASATPEGARIWPGRTSKSPISTARRRLFPGASIIPPWPRSPVTATPTKRSARLAKRFKPTWRKPASKPARRPTRDGVTLAKRRGCASAPG